MNPTPSLKIIIVEDHTCVRQDLEDLLQQQPGFTVIGACATVHEAIVLIHTTKPDLLLLDIGLPDGTGFDILEQMSPVQSKVIFLTAHSEYAIRAIRYGAIDYLLKPLDENELKEALQRVISAQPLLQEQIDITLQSFKKNKLQDHIALRSQQFVQIVALKEICYLQGDNGYTTVFLNGGKKVVTTRTLKDYEEQLSGTSFLRTHKSYLINESYIHRYHPKEGILYLKDATQIPVSFRKKEMVVKYFKWLCSAMYRFFVLTIFCMACNSSDKKGQQPASDSFLPFLKNTVNPLLQNRESTEARKKLDSILPIIEKKGDYVDLCSWLRCAAVVYQIENKLDSARLYAGRSLQLAMEKDTTQRQILAGKIQTADIMGELHSLDSALRYAHEAYFLAKKIDTPGLPFICLKLYNIYEKIGDLPMQKKYLFEGFMRSTSPKHKTVFATNISEYYDKVNQVDSALLFFQALLQDSSFSNPYYDAVRYETLGALLSKKGEAKKGLVYQLKGMQISRQLGELTAQSYFNVAATYRKLGLYKKDENLLDTALHLVTHEKNWALQKRIWRAKAENLTLQKEPWQANAAQDSAFGYFQKEVDSSIIGQARELEAKYSLLEKDNQIKSLALSHQESERTRERQRRAIVRIICGAAILGMLLVWMWRRKQLKRNIREESLRQQLLRGQIKSHFLYRSVDGLQQLIKKGNTGGATEFIQRLARLFRLSLENARLPFVPLKNELEALDNYLMLQQSLFDNQFDYEIKVEGISDLKAVLIPPMLLQPFTENAILHGFAGQKEKGQINISIQKNHKALHCVIEDNGRGFQVVEDHNQKRSLSTIINQERLQILSRQTRTAAQLKIIDKKATGGEAGVRVELILPYQIEH